MTALKPTFAVKPAQTEPYDATKLNVPDANELRAVAINHASLLDQLTRSISTALTQRVWGDSVQAEPKGTQVPRGAAIRQYGEFFASAPDNQAVSATRTSAGLQNVYDTNGLPTTRDFLAWLGFGINDLLLPEAPDRVGFWNNVRLWLEMAFVKEYVSYNDARLTYSSGWQEQDRPGYSREGKVFFTSDPTGKMDTPRLGQHMVFGLFAVRAEYVTTSVRVLFDGVLHTTLNPRLLACSADQYGVTVPIFLSVPPTVTKVTLQNNDNNNLFLSFLLVRKTPAEAAGMAPAVVLAASSQRDDMRNNLTQAQWDSFNATTRRVVALFGRYPAFFVDEPADFDPTTDTYDGRHPNATGAAKWLNALLALFDLSAS